MRLGTCLAIDDGGTLRGLLTIVHYPGVSWIGNVVVTPQLRGAGLGERLLRAAMDAARSRGNETVALYSVPKAVRLYERVGMERAGLAVALGATAPATPPRSSLVARLTEEHLADVAAFDQGCVGFDRTALLAELLRAYPGHAFLLRRGRSVAGFAFAKPAWSGSEIGPVVAATPEDAVPLLDAAVASLGGEPVDLAVPATNEPVLAHLAKLGFERRFEAPFMHAGPAPAIQWDRIAAVGGLEKG